MKYYITIFILINAFTQLNAQIRDSIEKSIPQLKIIIDSYSPSKGVLVIVFNEDVESKLDSKNSYTIYSEEAVKRGKSMNHIKLTKFQIEAIEKFLQKNPLNEYYINTCKVAYHDYQRGVGLILLKGEKKYFFLVRGCPVLMHELMTSDVTVNDYVQLLMIL